MEMVETWYSAEGYPPVPCPQCGAASEIRDYKMDMPWGFSQIAFAFWNTVGDLSQEFMDEFAAELGEPVPPHLHQDIEYFCRENALPGGSAGDRRNGG